MSELFIVAITCALLSCFNFKVLYTILIRKKKAQNVWNILKDWRRMKINIVMAGLYITKFVLFMYLKLCIGEKNNVPNGYSDCVSVFSHC